MGCRPWLLLVILPLVVFLPSCVVIEKRERGTSTQGGDEGGPDEELPKAEPAPLHAASDQALLGSLGWALLSEDVPRAVLEIDQLGSELLPGTVDALEQALRESGRKGTVERVVGAGDPPASSRSLEELVSLAADHRDHSSGGDTVALHVLVLPGQGPAEGVPGAAFHATTIALFPDQIGERLPPGANLGALQTAVVLHELGHTFGLVNRTGEGGFHEDPEHPGHADDEGSVMHWAIESPTLVEVFVTGPPADFTEADRREMERIRQGSPPGSP